MPRRMKSVLEFPDLNSASWLRERDPEARALCRTNTSGDTFGENQIRRAQLREKGDNGLENANANSVTGGPLPVTKL